MRAVTLLRYLVGDLDAARAIAADPWRAIGIGLLFLCSAMIAREYDGEYLPAEPIHIALPFLGGVGGALASGTLLYGVSRLRRGESPGYRTMLARWTACFLFMAPLAWLYAIPWDRMLSEHDAAVANLVVLGVVATWRVVLSIRVASMLFGASERIVSAILLAVGAPLAAAGLSQQALPMLATMGGGRLPVAVEVAAHASSLLLLPALFLSVLMPILGIAAVYDRSQLWNAAELDPPAPRTKGLLVIATVALLLGLPMLVIGQGEQRVGHLWDRAIAENRHDDALDVLRDHGQASFPPRWAPEPRVGWSPGRGRVVVLLDLLDRADARDDTPRWAREHWLRGLAEISYPPRREDGLERLLTRVAEASDEDAAILRAGEISVGLSYDDAQGLGVDASLLERARRRVGIDPESL